MFRECLVPQNRTATIMTRLHLHYDQYKEPFLVSRIANLKFQEDFRKIKTYIFHLGQMDLMDLDIPVAILL